MEKFANIHVHSEYSLLDGMSKVNDIVKKTLDLGQPGSCITDHGNLYAMVQHIQIAEELGQKPIIGFEAYVVNDHMVKDKMEAKANSDTGREHLILYAKDNEGYKRLSKICSIGMTDGFYYRPRIDDKVLQEVGTQGLIGASACMAGRIPKLLMKDDIEGAEKEILFYNKLFNNEFYLEIQPCIDPIQVKINKGLIELHKKLGIPIIATSDAHFLNREDKPAHDVLLAIQSKTTWNNPNRWSFKGDTYYIMSRQQIKDAFMCNGHETLDQNIVDEAISTTVDIINKCNVNINLGNPQLPVIKPPKDEKFEKWESKFKSDNTISDDYLRYICIQGLKKKGKTSAKYKDRLNYELNVIKEMGFSDYFLILSDLLEYSRNNDIPTGPARGCAKKGQLVNTKNGIKKIENVQIGDMVIGHDEISRKVINTLQYNCNEDIIKLETENNKELIMTKDHKIYAIKGEDFNKGIREPKWYTMEELNENDYICELE